MDQSMDQLISKLKDYANGKPSPNVKHTVEQNSNHAVALAANPSVSISIQKSDQQREGDLEIITPAEKDKAIAQQLSVNEIKVDHCDSKSHSNRKISSEGSGYERDGSAVLAHLKLEGQSMRHGAHAQADEEDESILPVGYLQK